MPTLTLSYYKVISQSKANLVKADVWQSGFAFEAVYSLKFPNSPSYCRLLANTGV